MKRWSQLTLTDRDVVLVDRVSLGVGQRLHGRRGHHRRPVSFRGGGDFGDLPTCGTVNQNDVRARPRPGPDLAMRR